MYHTFRENFFTKKVKVNQTKSTKDKSMQEFGKIFTLKFYSSNFRTHFYHSFIFTIKSVECMDRYL